MRDPGAQASDASGTGNDGTIHGRKFVGSPKGSAIRLDGVDDYVECGMSETLKALERAATFEMWIKPKALQGGLVNVSSGAELKDQRLVMVFGSKDASPGLSLITSDGSGIKKHARTYGLVLPEKGA